MININDCEPSYFYCCDIWGRWLSACAGRSLPTYVRFQGLASQRVVGLKGWYLGCVLVTYFGILVQGSWTRMMSALKDSSWS